MYKARKKEHTKDSTLLIKDIIIKLVSLLYVFVRCFSILPIMTLLNHLSIRMHTPQNVVNTEVGH